ncbi:MAG: hypothetical protein ACLP8S_19745 [Solirubrobacteraceae bacterium]
MSTRAVKLRVGGQRVEFDWGEHFELGSAAFWIDQTRQHVQPTDLGLGRTLREEVAACILGGYGLPAQVGLAAFRAVVQSGLLDAGRLPTAAELELVLLQPLHIGRAAAVHYRFPRQRAIRLTAALRYLELQQLPSEPHSIRRWLLECPGIGPKTAAWIIRNRRLGGDVAIVDVHIRRAGLVAGFFLPSWRLPRDYEWFENAFCAVASLGAVEPAALDACIWDICQSLGSARRLLLGDVVAA